MKVTFPLIFRSQLSVILMFSYIQHETRGACPQAQQMVFHLWMQYSDIHGRQWFISFTWLICLVPWDAQGSEKPRCAGLLTFQILFSPANGWLTSGVSAVAGNWHAWLLPPADWKLNMSFVSQGWAFIQSWLGIHWHISWGFDFMQKRSLIRT